MNTFEFIKRGDIYLADLNPVEGSEQGGIRPVLVIQNDIGNQYAPTVIVVPMTSKPKKKFLPTHIVLPKDLGLKNDSTLLFEQIRAIDKSRLISYIAPINKEIEDEVNKAISVSLDLEKLPMGKGSLITLCATCRSEFINTGAYNVWRDYSCNVKDVCTCCNYRRGFDYFIQSKEEYVRNQQNTKIRTFVGGGENE